MKTILVFSLFFSSFILATPTQAELSPLRAIVPKADLILSKSWFKESAYTKRTYADGYEVPSSLGPLNPLTHCNLTIEAPSAVVTGILETMDAYGFSQDSLEPLAKSKFGRLYLGRGKKIQFKNPPKIERDLYGEITLIRWPITHPESIITGALECVAGVGLRSLRSGLRDENIRHQLENHFNLIY